MPPRRPKSTGRVRHGTPQDRARKSGSIRERYLTGEFSLSDKENLASRTAGSLAAGSEPSRARLFTNGRSQAVRLPKAFRFPGSEVLIRRGEGDTVVLEPVASSAWPMGYWETIDDLADDLALGRVPPIGARLLDLGSEDV